MAKKTIEELKAELEEAIGKLDNDTTWQEMLTHLATFGVKYSAANQALIYFTCMGRGITPRKVQSFNAWKAEDHWVRKDERAIWILGPVKRRLRPDEVEKYEKAWGRKIPRNEKGWSEQKYVLGFKPVPVFDVAQVHDPETVVMPEPVVQRRMVLMKGPRPELLSGDDVTGALPEVEHMVKAMGLDLAYVDPGILGGANGDTNGHRVRVRNDVDDAQKIKTLVHEWAHNLLGHTDPNYGYSYNRGKAECEAESTAFVVCGALGLDTGAYSAPYVNSWSEGKVEIIRSALDNITTAARTMLDALSPADDDQDENEVSA